jgi:hypothetical protein
MNKSIPVVIIHTSYKDYLKINLEISGIKNKIYLIGDNDVKQLENINNVTFVDINKYRELQYIKDKKKNFINYSSNNANFEWICFERVFILKFFMEEYKLENIFHMDSDNILLTDINTYPFKKNIAYCVNKNYHTYRMSNSIHTSLLTLEFCNKFIQLYEDLYVNKSKFFLIEDKIKFHTNEKTKRYINGGICDMTLYYLLISEGILDVQNLVEPNDGNVFINNINNGEGYDSKEQYEIKSNLLKINIMPKNITVNDIKKNVSYKLMNIHFQGGAKRLLNEQFKHVICPMIE